LRVEVTLFATLSAYRPPGSALASAISLEIGEGGTLASLVESLAIPAEVPYLALVNGQDAASDHGLADGDSIALFPPLAGGAR
jgi:molybdopterin converting factor small subunit